jgi:hypothetical protein
MVIKNNEKKTNISQEKITYRGLFNMLNCYYEVANQHSAEFKAFAKNLPSPKQDVSLLFEFFEKNAVDFSLVGNQKKYLAKLFVEIHRVWSSGYTDIQLRIGEGVGTCALFALSMRNKALAEQCNLISKNKNCPFTYSMHRFPEFYSKYKDDELDHDENALSFLSQSKDFHEHAIFHFIYKKNLIDLGESFAQQWFFEKKVKPNDSTVRVLKWFAAVYENFLDLVFPGIINQRDCILQLVELVVEENSQMAVRDLLGNRFTWSSPSSSLSPEAQSFFVHFRDEHSVLKRGDITVARSKYIEMEVKEHRDFFISFFMRCLRDAVLDCIIIEMNQRFGYTMNRPSDYLLVHPNHVDEFYSVVRDLYTSRRLYNVTFFCVFSEAYINLSPAGKYDFLALLEQFEDNADNFEDALLQCDERNIYPANQDIG